MPASACPSRATTEALIHDRLEGAERRAAQEHLEHCAACRGLFRQATADWFPRIRQYTIVERIGRGGFGEVFRAVHHAKERTEALKVLSEESGVRVRYFQNEVHLVARLRHPNIATLYEANLNNPPLYFTMEFVEGEQLGAYLKRQQLGLDQRLRLFRTIAEAVGHAHTQGVVHRDIKPQNVLIDATGQPRLVDFGIAKWLDAPTDGRGRAGPAEGAVGTYGYIAPEQRSGGPVDTRADIYGLGALLFHMVTGEPAQRAARTARLGRLLHKWHVARADDLAAIIGRCLEPLPEQRYTACAALVRDLDNYLAGRPIEARGDATLAYRAARLAALVLRNSPLVVELVVVLVVTLGLAALLSAARTGWFAPGPGIGRAALVVFTPETEAALRAGTLGADLPGLDPARPHSLRVLHGALLAAIGSGRPSVIAWDYFVPDCQPEYDAALLAGASASGVPVVIGCAEVDINGEPRLCADILAGVHGYGLLSNPRVMHQLDRVEMALAMQRGASPNWTPTLSVAAFAAARFPDSRVHLQPRTGALELRYERRDAPAGSSRWRDEIDTLPVHDVTTIADDGRRHVANVRVGDRHLIARLDGRRHRVPPERVYGFEQVLAAGPQQRTAWFAGRAVVVGHRLPGRDVYQVGTDEIWGCEQHALALDALLAEAEYVQPARADLALRVLAWAVLTLVAVRWLPPPGSVRPGMLAAMALVALVVGITVTAVAAQRPGAAWAVELGIAIGVGLTCGGPLVLLRGLREEQMRLVSLPVLHDDTSTLSHTLELRSSDAEPP